MDSSHAKLTPPQLAALWQMKPAKVISFIRSGELPATNVGQGLKKPRYLIGDDDIAVFEQRRRVVPPPPATPTRRKRAEAKPAGWVNYFS